MSLCWCDDVRHTHRMATVIQRVLRPSHDVYYDRRTFTKSL